jgi:HEAT repeat protein
LSNLSFDELISILQSGDSHRRWEAAIELGKREDRHASPYLLAALHDPHRAVRMSAAKALASLHEVQAVAAIIQLFKDEDFDVRCTAVEALNPHLTEAAYPHLLNLLRSPDADPRLREGAAWAIQPMEHPEVVPVLLAILRESDSELRQASISRLGYSGNEQAVVPIIDALQSDPDIYVRRAAASALGCLGDSRAIQPLIDALNDPTERLHGCAIESLIELNAVEAIDEIAKMINHPDFLIRMSIAYAFAGFENRRASDYVAQLLDDEHEEVRQYAVKAVGSIEEITLIPKLYELQADNSELVRQEVAIVLAKLRV